MRGAMEVLRRNMGEEDEMFTIKMPVTLETTSLPRGLLKKFMRGEIEHRLHKAKPRCSRGKDSRTMLMWQCLRAKLNTVFVSS